MSGMALASALNRRDGADEQRQSRARFGAAVARLLSGSVLTFGGMIALGVPGQAFAQQAGGDAAAAGSESDEIVVTAEKRDSTVLKTPLSITAVSGAELQSRGVARFEDLARGVPGVAMRTSGPGQTEFQMRGLSSAGGASPIVAFYLDETPLTPPSSASNGKVVVSPSLFDLSRVEVLRGPQGTLYGAGSMGGAIKLVTNSPVLNRVEGNGQAILSATEGGGINYTANAMINLPLVQDRLALRLVGSHERRSGWIDRIVLDPFPLSDGVTRGDVLSAPVSKRYKNVNDAEVNSARASLLFRPTDALTITPAVFYEDIDSDGMDLVDRPPGKAAHYEASDFAEPFSDRFRLASLTVQYDLGGATLTNALSYWHRRQRQAQDAAESLQTAFGETSYVPGANSTETETTHQFSEELRLASGSGSRLQWLIGGFYSDFYSRYHQEVIAEGFATQYGLDANLFTGTNPTRIKQIAGFGQATYPIADRLSATAGLRYYKYKLTTSSIYSGSLASPPSSGRNSETGLNPRFNLSYTPTPDSLIYANVAKGFRPGGGNGPVPQSQCAADLAAIGRTSAPDSYDSDDLWSYEAGAKGRLFGGRLRVAASVYLEDWKDVQQVIPMACGFNFTDNAAKARVYGGELEAEIKLSRALTISGNAGYAHAELTRVTPNTPFNRGDRLQSVPAWTWSLSGEYRQPLSDAVEMVARAGATHVGNRIDVTASRNYLPGYTLADLRLGIETGSWSYSLFVDNLTNKHAQLSNSPSYSVNVPTFNRVTTNQPRTFGVNVSKRF